MGLGGLRTWRKSEGSQSPQKECVVGSVVKGMPSKIKNSSKGGGYHSSQRKLGPGMMERLAAQEPVGGTL